MTYTSGSLIEAVDYNGFIGTNPNNINDIWGVGATDKGYGQTALSTVSASSTVTATNWASLVNTISSIANHQNTSITSRTAPTAGNLIQILTNLNTDITSITTNRGNAAASGSEITSWTGSSAKTTATGSGVTPWTITFTHTITFPSANQARYFWNAGGIVRLRVSKSSTGTQADTEWNDLAGTLMNEIRLVGRVNSANQVIGGVTYTGVNKTSGTGTPSIHATTTGWYNLTTSDTNIYRQFADTYPYTDQYINVAARTAGTGTQLVLTTTWVDPGQPDWGSTDVISGGTDTASPFTAFGTAPATVVTLFPPSSTNITNTWGTPTIAASVA
jgi:hypothetical protein